MLHLSFRQQLHQPLRKQPRAQHTWKDPKLMDRCVAAANTCRPQNTMHALQPTQRHTPNKPQCIAHRRLSICTVKTYKDQPNPTLHNNTVCTLSCANKQVQCTMF